MSRGSALGLSEVFGRQVRKARRLRDWSQQELADAISKVVGSPEGYPMKQANIAKLEAGQRKRLVVEDVLLFAAALEVSPVHLLVPFDDDAEVDFGIGAVPAIKLRHWIEGADWFGDDPPPHNLRDFQPDSRTHFEEMIAAVIKVQMEMMKVLGMKTDAEEFAKALPDWVDEAASWLDEETN